MRLGALLTLGVTWPLLFATPKLGLVKRAVESGGGEQSVGLQSVLPRILENQESLVASCSVRSDARSS